MKRGAVLVQPDAQLERAFRHVVLDVEDAGGRRQCRERRITKVILAGMSANLCVESHLRELLEQGFEVAVVTDATAAAQAPGLDGYAAALVNFRFLANTLWTTAEATGAMKAAAKSSE